VQTPQPELSVVTLHSEGHVPASAHIGGGVQVQTPQPVLSVLATQSASQTPASGQLVALHAQISQPSLPR
jgi:hypothetical protein